MTDNLTLNMDAYLPLRDVVFNTLREAILKGELKPGERLMELQLASKLGVSRTPIREAIRMLEQEGLAVTMPRKGAEVAKMTLKDMEDVLEVREALDELAAKIVHVLCCYFNVCSFACFYNRNNIDSRNTEYYVNFFVSYEWFQSFY